MDERRNPHQAAHVVRAFRYQLLQSVQAWLDLRENEVLRLEVSEDFSIVSQERSEDVQVKHSATKKGSTSVSLRSAGVRESVKRYWERSNAGQDPIHHLTFLATSGAAREQGLIFPNNTPGLLYWHMVANDGDTAPLRAALKEIFDGESLGEWLAGDPEDHELRARLLQRIRFALDAAGDANLETVIIDQVSAIYLAKNHYAEAANQCVPVLLNRVFAAASSAEETGRQLTFIDLHRSIEDSIPKMGALVLNPASELPSESGYAVQHLLARPGLIGRQATVEAIRNQTSNSPLIWIQGANGVGKTTLAGLLAQSRDGPWLLCDFRPYSERTDTRAVLPVWRELMFKLRSEPSSISVVLDDISASGFDLLKQRIAGLATVFAGRGSQIIVTSNHTPSSALLEELGAPQSALIDAPYFSREDVSELVAQVPAPLPNLIKPWAHLIHLSTSAGHPLLAVAKTVNLRARGWPDDAFVEDFGPEPSKAIQVTRQEARRRLLTELPSQEAGQMLKRMSTVFGGFEDGLVFKLCETDPPISNPGDSLVLLKGSWIEPGHEGDWRVSPLLADLGKEEPIDQARRWRRIAAEYWVRTGVLSARTLPLCFWNAFLGQHVLVLAKLDQTIQTLPPEGLRSAAGMLSPLATLRTDVSLFPEEPMIAASLRLLQVCVADAVEDQKSAISAATALLRDIEAVPHDEYRILMSIVGAWRVLTATYVHIPPTLQLTYLSNLDFITVSDSESLGPSIRGALDGLAEIAGSDVDIRGVLFAGILLRISSSEQLETMVNALEEIDPVERSNLLGLAIAALEGDRSFVHNGWAKEQLAGQNLEPVLTCYMRMNQIVSAWEDHDLEAEFAIARSVILDEGLDDKVRALAVIDDTVNSLGSLPALIRQKSKVHRHHGEDHAAAALFLQFEEHIDQLIPVDRALALRDGGIVSAKIGQLEDAARLFARSRATLEEENVYEALQVGLKIEEAYVMWARRDRPNALSTLADILETLEGLDPTTSRRNQWAHKMGRAVIGFFLLDLDPFPIDPLPAFSFGTASVLESSNKPEYFDLKPLADNWHLLEVLEIEAHVDVGIANQSARHQGPTRVITIESLIANARYSAALQRRDLPATLVAAQAAVSIIRMVASKSSSESEKLTRANVDEFGPFDIETLRALGYSQILQGTLCDILVDNALNGLWNDALESKLEAEVVTAWGDDALLQPLCKASSGSYALGPTAPLPVVICSQLKTLNDEESIGPSDRFLRDLRLVEYVANSLARHHLEPRIVALIESGWRLVIEHQRFSLSDPRSSAVLIDTALQVFRKTGIRAARSLFEAAAPAIGVQLSSKWDAFFTGLEGRKRGSV